MSLRIENDLIERYCDQCNKKWNGGAQDAIQKESIIGDKMIQKMQKMQFICTECVEEKDGWRIAEIRIPKEYLLNRI